jgi:hypothetical protein
MAYYQANTESDAIICDNCGDARWETHPKYGTNVDARLEEAKRTGVRWSWVPRWSSDAVPCDSCGTLTK